MRLLSERSWLIMINLILANMNWIYHSVNNYFAAWIPFPEKVYICRIKTKNKHMERHTGPEFAVTLELMWATRKNDNKNKNQRLRVMMKSLSFGWSREKQIKLKPNRQSCIYWEQGALCYFWFSTLRMPLIHMLFVIPHNFPVMTFFFLRTYKTAEITHQEPFFLLYVNIPFSTRKF